MKINIPIWCDFDRASSLICGNKMPTRCNIGFYCRSYSLLNMFRAPLCPSSGAQAYYTVLAACGISCCKNVKSKTIHHVHFHTITPHKRDTWPTDQAIRYKKPTKNTHTRPPRHSTHPVINLDNTRHLRLITQIPQNLQNYFLHFHSTKYHRQQPLYNTLELLMMGIVMPETCWASNKICNKNLCCI